MEGRTVCNAEPRAESSAPDFVALRLLRLVQQNKNIKSHSPYPSGHRPFGPGEYVVENLDAHSGTLEPNIIEVVKEML